jgi:hypothetical protein
VEYGSEDEKARRARDRILDTMLPPIRICGVDFTSAPRARKPITVAHGAMRDGSPDMPRLRIDGVDALGSFEAWERWLAAPGPWVAGFDFPFAFARVFAAAQGWPLEGPHAWAQITERVAELSRGQLIERCRAWCDARPAGDKFARRATEGPAGCSAAMKWVNPPVALMLHAGAPRLLHAGVDIPGLHRGDPRRVALEAYPGLLAREVLARESYKSDERARQTPGRRAMRERLAASLEQGQHSLGIGLDWSPAVRAACLDDASGDRLDAVLCALQAAWGWLHRHERYGLPEHLDPIEGWIVTAAAPARP